MDLNDLFGGDESNSDDLSDFGSDSDGDDKDDDKPKKRGPGRPLGSKNKNAVDFKKAQQRRYDELTGAESKSGSKRERSDSTNSDYTSKPAEPIVKVFRFN
jgi:hypothetical protein